MGFTTFYCELNKVNLVKLSSGSSRWRFHLSLHDSHTCNLKMYQGLFFSGGGLCYVKNCPWISWLLTFRVLDCLMYMCLVDWGTREVYLSWRYSKRHISECASAHRQKRRSAQPGYQWSEGWKENLGTDQYPIGSMHGIFTNMDH